MLNVYNHLEERKEDPPSRPPPISETLTPRNETIAEEVTTQTCCAATEESALWYTMPAHLVRRCVISSFDPADQILGYIS